MSLTGREIKDSYKDLLLVNNNNRGVDTTLRNVQDGEGTYSPLLISQTEVKISDINGDHTVIHEGNLSSNVDFSATVTATENARDAAISAKDDAEDARDLSSSSANLATTAKTAAESAASQAGQDRAAAESASTDSNVHQQNAQLFKNEAQAAKTAADLAQAAAESEAEDAALSASQALSSKNAAASSASSALTHKNAAASSASTASTQAGHASTDAQTAVSSKNAAATSKNAAATSATNAANSASSAATSATNSANSASSSSASALAAVAAKDAAADHLATAQLNSAFNGGIISSALTIANSAPRIDLRDSNHAKTDNGYQSYLQYLDKSNSQAGYVGYSSNSNKILTVYNSVDRVNIASQGFTYNNNNVTTQVSGFQVMNLFLAGNFSDNYPNSLIVRYSKIGSEVTLFFEQLNQNVVIGTYGVIYDNLPFTPIGVDFFGIAGPVNQGKLSVRIAGGGGTLVLENEEGVVATQTNMNFQVKYLTAS